MNLKTLNLYKKINQHWDKIVIMKSQRLFEDLENIKAKLLTDQNSVFI